jgi:hypothetical protein
MANLYFYINSVHLLVYMGDYCHVYVIELSEILDVVLCPCLNIHNISQVGFVFVFRWNR